MAPLGRAPEPTGDVKVRQFADEPTGNLDSKNAESVMELLRELHRGGATICMATHDTRYADFVERTVHLFDGRVVDESREARIA